MALVIKKKVYLDFLGEDYKEAYLVFQSIPLKDFDQLSEDILTAQKDKKAATFILSSLKKYFIEGSFPGVENMTANDLDGLDQESVLKCFTVFTGQEINRESGTEVPQVEALKDGSKTPSSTEAPGQSN